MSARGGRGRGSGVPIDGTCNALLSEVRSNARQLAEQMAKGAELDAVIREKLEAMGYAV